MDFEKGKLLFNFEYLLFSITETQKLKIYPAQYLHVFFRESDTIRANGGWEHTDATSLNSFVC